MTARERIDYLLDPKAKCIEGLLLVLTMADVPLCCSKMGYIKGKQCIVANDATVKAGAWFPITAKKNLRTRNRHGKSYHLFSR
jgi:acetyl-CoA carboxylase carboxyltransferase component